VPIDVAIEAGIATVTVNRPDAMNAIDLEHATLLRDALEELGSDEAARVVVLTGAGEKAFIAGADIKYMRDLDVTGAKAWGDLGQRCGVLLETMPKPTIAAVNGFALGGGCELALACDLRIASSTARLGQPEVSLGVIPGWGGTQRLARTTSLGFAKDLCYTGRIVAAEEALTHGLVDAVHPPEELMAKVRELAEVLASKGPLALAATKEACNLALQGDHAENLETEARLFSELFATEDQKEGMAGFVEKREARFTGR
jgi:enoyl-CoA hydratase